MQEDRVIRLTSDLGLIYYCPGCLRKHIVYVDSNKKPCCGWNGDIVKPTFTPSVIVRHTPTYTDKELEQLGQEQLVKDIVCHSYITGGKIRYLSDTNHHLSGKTVDMVKV